MRIPVSVFLADSFEELSPELKKCYPKVEKLVFNSKAINLEKKHKRSERFASSNHKLRKPRKPKRKKRCNK